MLQAVSRARWKHHAGPGNIHYLSARPMDFHDLDEARALHGALMEVFVAHTGGRENPEGLARVTQLTDAATNAIEDVECRGAMRGVKRYSQLLFSHDGHLGIDAGSLNGVGYLRLPLPKALRPDVVLCDIGLPDSNGFIVASALREDPATCSARLIAVTAYGQDEDRRRAREAGFDLHLVKPVDPEVLLRRIEA